ncbi:MAG: hypothetical protein HC804_04555 [Anaerolineae bacterium]|nr:hypothetical protein [Anaerolineae bacterium]
MARTALTVTEIPLGGVTDALTAANVDGHSVVLDRNAATFIEVNNGAGAPITVTIVTPKTSGGLAVADRTVTVVNAEREKISLEDFDNYRQDDGTVHVDFSSVTTITCAAYKVTKD